MKWPSHGSNPQYLYREAGISMPEHLLDFSANINPLGPPGVLREKWLKFFDGITDYPDPFVSSLKENIAEKEGLPADSVLIGNGGAELIALVGKMLAGKNVLIIEPSFSEYERACRANGCHILYYQVEPPSWMPYEEELFAVLKNVDAVFLCNPNNPTGIVYSREFIVKFLGQCRKNDTLLIVDEAFYDFVENYEPLHTLLTEYDNLLLLRSMTKMFAIPGIRLGYCLSSPALIQELGKSQPHWSVNALAIQAGEECLKEEEFVRTTVQYIKSERKKLFSFFENGGFEYSPSKVNFYLLRDAGLNDQYPLFEFLLRKGIVPRHTFNFPGLDGRWLRFAIKGESDNQRLMEVLSEWKAVR